CLPGACMANARVCCGHAKRWCRRVSSVCQCLPSPDACSCQSEGAAALAPEVSVSIATSRGCAKCQLIVVGAAGNATSVLLSLSDSTASRGMTGELLVSACPPSVRSRNGCGLPCTVSDGGSAASSLAQAEGFGPIVKSSVAPRASSACGRVSLFQGLPLTRRLWI